MKCHPNGAGTLLPEKASVNIENQKGLLGSVVLPAAPVVKPVDRINALARRYGLMSGEVRLLAAVLGAQAGKAVLA